MEEKETHTLDLNPWKASIWRPLLADNREYMFTFFPTTTGKLLTEVYVGVPVTDDYEEKLFTARPFFHVASLHTHPSILSRKWNPPSSRDFRFFLISYFRLNLKKNMVVSQEGMYVVSLKPEFVKYLEETFADQIQTGFYSMDRFLFGEFHDIDPAFSTFVEDEVEKQTNDLHVELAHERISLAEYMDAIRKLGFDIELLDFDGDWTVKFGVEDFLMDEVWEWMQRREFGDIGEKYIFPHARDFELFAKQPAPYFDFQDTDPEALVESLFKADPGTIFRESKRETFFEKFFL